MNLLPMSDAHFAWLLGQSAIDAAPRLPQGGVASAEILDLMRGVAAEVGGEAAWLMVADDEAVGIVSIKERDSHGRWDIGYGVAPDREGRGHATAAVAAFKSIARAQGARGLTAETLPDSGASPRVLQRNGFTCIGQFDHPEDGVVDQWVLEWTA